MQDPVEQMRLDEKRRAVEAKEKIDDAKRKLEEMVRASAGPGKAMPLAIYPAPVLATKADNNPLSLAKGDLKELASNMRFTMYACGGVGLAATQVARNERMFIADWSQDRKTPVVVINPIVLWASDEVTRMREGCLSFPGAFVNVSRPAQIKVRFQTLETLIDDLELEGWAARIFLHELDHLNGTTMLDHANRLEKRAAIKKVGRLKKFAKPKARKRQRR